MRVKRFELAGPAPEPQEDDRLCRLVRPLGLTREQLSDRRQPRKSCQFEEAAAFEDESAR